MDALRASGDERSILAAFALVTASHTSPTHDTHIDGSSSDSCAYREATSFRSASLEDLDDMAYPLRATPAAKADTRVTAAKDAISDKTGAQTFNAACARRRP
jgi:hypothetical protein